MERNGILALKNYLNNHHNNYYNEAEKLCNQTVLSHPPPKDGLYCPAVIDDWGICFNYTKAGVTAYLPCPALSVFNRHALSFRHCEDNGTWQIILNGKPWTNTSACSQNASLYNDFVYHQSLSYLYLFIAGAFLSLVLVTISLIIFCGFRQLRCDRITLHKNLFLSYELTALTWILYYRLVVFDGMVIIRNPVDRDNRTVGSQRIQQLKVWCQLLHVLAQYFAACNFSWMFCEGLYLHIIMAHALRTGKKLIKCLIFSGWGVPFVLTLVYAIIRGAASEEAHSCWINDDVLQWIIGAPVVASIIINSCILVNLVRLLMTKLKQIPNAPESRKAAKATLILLPLLGLQFLLFPVRPDKDSVLYPVYLHFMSLLTSLQGTMVSVIFCFCNGEVKSIIRRKWHQHRLMSSSGRKQAGFTSSTVVDCYSVIDSTRETSCLKAKVVQDAYQKNIEAEEMKLSPMVTTPLVQKSSSAEVGINQIDD